jgi:hypothetical protein
VALLYGHDEKKQEFVPASESWASEHADYTLSDCQAEMTGAPGIAVAGSKNILPRMNG